jgi:hypothetical protein
MSAVTRDYCQRYAIKQISLELQSGVVDTADRVCHLELEFDAGYKVQFKLQGAQALLGEKLSQLQGDGTVTTLAGVDTTSLEADLENFFKSIAGRLQRILHEEDVQNIEYLGNTFELNGKTVFDVVADEDGRLTISMHRGAERQEAMLLASSLLDGLYDGSISLVE